MNLINWEFCVADGCQVYGAEEHWETVFQFEYDLTFINSLFNSPVDSKPFPPIITNNMKHDGP